MEIAKWRKATKTVGFLDMALAIISAVLIAVALIIRIQQGSLDLINVFGISIMVLVIVYWQIRTAWRLAKATAEYTDLVKALKFCTTWKITSFLLLILYSAFIVTFFYIGAKYGVEFDKENIPIFTAFVCLFISFIFRTVCIIIVFQFTSVLKSSSRHVLHDLSTAISATIIK